MHGGATLGCKGLGNLQQKQLTDSQELLKSIKFYTSVYRALMALARNDLRHWDRVKKSVAVLDSTRAASPG
jgi:hypothetical protein